MPKKKRGRARRPGPAPVRGPQRPSAPQREPGVIDRLKKNPFTVLLGVIVVGSMVLALAGDIFVGNRQQPGSYTPTEAATVPVTPPTLSALETPTVPVSPSVQPSPTAVGAATPAVPSAATVAPPAARSSPSPEGSPTAQPSPTR